LRRTHADDRYACLYVQHLWSMKFLHKLHIITVRTDISFFCEIFELSSVTDCIASSNLLCFCHWTQWFCNVHNFWCFCMHGSASQIGVGVDRGETVRMSKRSLYSISGSVSVRLNVVLQRRGLVGCRLMEALKWSLSIG